MEKLRKFFLKLSGLRIALAIGALFLWVHINYEQDDRDVSMRGKFFSKDGLLYRMEFAALDAKFQARSLPIDPKVSVAAVDEKSVEKYGLWPWRRTLIADLIDRLAEYDARVIAFDMVFADEDRNSSFRDLARFKELYDESGLYRQARPALLGQIGEKITSGQAVSLSLARDLKLPLPKKQAQSLALSFKDMGSELQSYEEKSQRFYDALSGSVRSLSPDEALAKSVRAARQKIVMGAFAFQNQSEFAGVSETRLAENFARVKSSGVVGLTESVKDMGGQLAETPFDGVWKSDDTSIQTIGIQGQLPVIADAAAHVGLFNVHIDPDRTIRRLPTVFLHEDTFLPSLSLKAFSVYSNAAFAVLASPTHDNRIGGVAVGDGASDGERRMTLVPTNSSGQMLINYYGAPERIIPTVSIADILEKKADPALLKGRAVLVGVTAIGTFDLRPTPYGTVPGVYLQAMGLQNMIDRQFLDRWSGFPLVEGLLLILIALLAGLILPKTRISVGALASVAAIAAVILFDYFYVFANGYWMRVVGPVLEIGAIYTAITAYRYFVEEREKRRVRSVFQFYLSKGVVESVLTKDVTPTLGGEKRDMSVLFSDVRGFTTISERLSPVDLVHLLNEYLTPMTDIVFEHDGTLDKYMGDAVMAFWGAPADQPDHAVRACVTALDMMTKLRVLQDAWRVRNLPEIDIGIGINSGSMAVGNMGSTQRFDYTVMGDNVNLGSRLEGINKEYGTNIIISEFTYERAKHEVYGRLIDQVRVKGKLEPVRIYELRGRGRPSGQEETFMAAFDSAWGLYREQQWDAAIAAFEGCMKLEPADYCSRKYIERCESMKEHPPGEGWDGVYTMKTK